MAEVAVIAILLAGAVTTIKTPRMRKAADRFRQAARYHKEQERLIIT
jgi:hypothetical protein